MGEGFKSQRPWLSWSAGKPSVCLGKNMVFWCFFLQFIFYGPKALRVQAPQKGLPKALVKPPQLTLRSRWILRLRFFSWGLNPHPPAPSQLFQMYRPFQQTYRRVVKDMAPVCIHVNLDRMGHFMESDELLRVG